MKEITPEVKARIMALYLGTDIEYPDTNNKKITARLTTVGLSEIETTYKRKRKGCVGDILSFKSNGNHKCDALNTKLSLFTLSAITDEDAMEVKSIINKQCIGEESGEHLQITLNDILGDIEVLALATFETVDYLRSKGYALPYLHWTVDELIEAGLFKIKKN